MNKAITDGLVLMPPPFSAGLNQWSREDGTPGSATYAGQPNAALVPSDQDFGGCLELQKLDVTQKLRSMAEIPIEPGLYLRVTARVKAVAGNLPSVRIAAWAGRINGTNVAVPSFGPATTLSSYGDVVTITAIIGSGNRQGVDMVWGTEPVFGHFGLDLTGANGGVVRIDDIVIEDVSDVFFSKTIGTVDVRDFGAIGNGVADDSAAFNAADAAANGRTVVVSDGTYKLNSNITFESAVRFEGTVTMPAGIRLSCTRNYNLDTYTAAFGTELEGFRRGLQALFYFSDHVTFDLSGRRVDLTGPIDVADVVGLTSFGNRRVLANGQLNALASAEWATTTVTSVATYTASDFSRLTDVANVANVPVGARVIGTGVGREVYVKSKNVAAGTVTLSNPLWGAAGTRTFTFSRYQYMLDFSGFASLNKFEIIDMEIVGNEFASGIMLPLAGITFRVADSVFNKPKDRGITSIGTGCQGMFVDQCQFLSSEQDVVAQSRTSVAINTNANDTKLRDNRVVKFGTFAVIGGISNIIMGNHFFQGDGETNGIRQAGIVFCQTNCATLMSGNYIDNCFIEWANDHDPAPGFLTEFSFGGLTIANNIFICSGVAPSFTWFVVKPRGPGHFINGLNFSGNTFRTVNAAIDRVERIDTTQATMDFSRFRNIEFGGNTFNGISQATLNPVTIEHVQNTAADTWIVDSADYLPFGARARNVTGVVAEGAITTATNVQRFDMPYVQLEQGAQNDQINLRWPVDVKGRMHVTMRCDSPA
ncbi:MAG: glycosyl hydrolase family 28-related protein [Paracoccaceae bacterium]